MARTTTNPPQRKDDDDDDEVVDLTVEKKTEKKPAAAKKKKKGLPSAAVPVMLGSGAAKEGHNTLLVEVDAVNLGNDTGAIGRLNIKDEKLRLDIKGYEHDASIVPCRSLFVVSVNSEEAKIESVISEYAKISSTSDGLRHITNAVREGHLGDVHFNDIDVNKLPDNQKKKKAAPKKPAPKKRAAPPQKKKKPAAKKRKV